MRSDAIAYQPDFAPTSGLANAQVGLGGVTAATSANGAFTIKTSITPSTDATMLNASFTGYMPAWYPWFQSDTTQPIPLGVYPEVQAVARPGFMKGVIMMDDGGVTVTMYSTGRFASTLDRIKNTVSANLASHVDAFWVTRFDPATNTVTMGPDGWGLGTKTFYESVVGMAHVRGLQFMMMLTIGSAYPGDSALNANWGAKLSIPKTNEAFWDVFFAAWRPLVLERAAVARDLGVEYLGLGHNLLWLSRTSPSRWRSLIQAIRDLGYTGKIVYFTQTRFDAAFNEIQADDPSFPSLFDAIGFTINNDVFKTTPAEVLDRAQTRARIRASVATFLDSQAALSVPMILMVATPSVFGGVSNNEYIEPTLGTGSNSLAPLRTRDYQQQADSYQAIAEAVNATPTGSGHVIGLMTWGYWYTDNPTTSGFKPNDAAFDKSANIRGKPAESVLNWWFKRW